MMAVAVATTGESVVRLATATKDGPTWEQRAIVIDSASQRSHKSHEWRSRLSYLDCNRKI